MSPWRFQIIVLRFIALWIRKTTTGMWTKQDAANLLEDIEGEIERYARDTGMHDSSLPWTRDLPTGTKIKEGQVVHGD